MIIRDKLAAVLTLSGAGAKVREETELNVKLGAMYIRRYIHRCIPTYIHTGMLTDIHTCV